MNNFSVRTSKAIDHLRKELGSLRTGRANPTMIADLMVEAYGAMTPLEQVASITVPEARLLVVQPWDAAIVKDIAKAINQSSLGISPVVDGKLIRLPIPTMTEERRKEMLKVINEKAEAARVSIRNGREEQMKDLKQQQAAGELAEDVAKDAMADVQQQVTTANDQIATMAKEKGEEIMTV